MDAYVSKVRLHVLKASKSVESVESVAGGRLRQCGGRTEGSSPCTGHVAYQRSCDTDGNACYERSLKV